MATGNQKLLNPLTTVDENRLRSGDSDRVLPLTSIGTKTSTFAGTANLMFRLPIHAKPRGPDLEDFTYTYTRKALLNTNYGFEKQILQRNGSGDENFDPPRTANATSSGPATGTNELIACPVIDQGLRPAELDPSPPQTPNAAHANMARLQDWGQVAATPNKLYQTPFPTVKKRGRQFNGKLDSSPPFAVRKRDYNNVRSIDSTWPVFCCDSNEIYPLNIEDDPFSEFKSAANNMISEAEYYWHNLPEMIDHLIKVEPYRQKVYHAVRTRYFLYTKQHQYREICPTLFDNLMTDMDAVLSFFTINHCEIHGHQYHLAKFERVEITGNGLKAAELSPRQLSKEKRDVMVRKLSQGRQEEIAQMEKRLKGATKEELEEVASHVTFDRKDEVSEVARKLSSGKADEEGGTKLHVARVNMYYSELFSPTTP